MGFSRVLRSVLVGLVVTAGATLGVASSAYASGGGCATSSQTVKDGTAPWNIGSCSSDDGVNVYGDAYVNVVGYQAGGCNIKLQIIDQNTHLEVAARQDSCYAGHHPRISARMATGHTYRTTTRLNTNMIYRYWFSPITKCC